MRSMTHGAARGLGASRLLAAVLLVAFCMAARPVWAAEDARADLPIVRPVQACGALAKLELRSVAGATVTIAAASARQTPKGAFCEVTGRIHPAIGFRVDLPLTHWTQRYLEIGCGGLCGMIPGGIMNAGNCAPALDGEFTIAADDMGHESVPGDANAAFGAFPQQRIDFAYRANHVTTLVAKALIRAFYGQPQKYAYFMGCSDGGREALMEAQRFAGDFDGISAGAPAALFQVQNSFYHAWSAMTNKRADGSNILLQSRLSILHDAVVAHCETLSGVKDGLLQDPRSCRFDPAWVRCAKSGTDTSGCLTDEEIAVVQKQYAGPTDAAGHRFIIGGAPMGSEDQWYMPRAAGDRMMSEGIASDSMRSVILPTVSPADADLRHFAFTPATFARISVLHPLYDATNTDLRAYQRHGGKLILWHGWSDTSITPFISIAYYQGVQTAMGAATTDGFLRLFMMPGIGHCGGGDGYTEFDLLSPLMAWVERGHAPTRIIAGRLAGPLGGLPMRGAPHGPGGPHMPNGPPPHGPPLHGLPLHGPPLNGPPSLPLAAPARATVATRPIYPYPMIAHFTGHGDPNDAANYVAVASPVTLPEVFDTPSTMLIATGQQKTYLERDGNLVATAP